jgi:hypothetical protein
MGRSDAPKSELPLAVPWIDWGDWPSTVMFNWLPTDCEVVIWAYIVEILSLREVLPEKQSPKRGVATWASVMGNKNARKRKEDDIGEREEERRERQAVQESEETTTIIILLFSAHHITHSLQTSLILHPVSTTPHPLHVLRNPPRPSPMIRPHSRPNLIRPPITVALTLH